MGRRLVPKARPDAITYNSHISRAASAVSRTVSVNSQSDEYTACLKSSCTTTHVQNVIYSPIDADCNPPGFGAQPAEDKRPTDESGTATKVSVATNSSLVVPNGVLLHFVIYLPLQRLCIHGAQTHPWVSVRIRSSFLTSCRSDPIVAEHQ